MTPDYSPKSYYRVSMNRKRQIIDQQLDELHNMQLDMIDAAVEASDMQQARDVIKYIKERT
jgi:plasmid maintenance system killer protein